MIAINRGVVILCVLFNLGTCEDGYCDAFDDKCSDISRQDRLLFYDVNPQEGFNLKRDVYMRFAIATVNENRKGKEWSLVLPPWYRLYHWKSQDYRKSKPIPWSAFFDLKAMQTFAPVLELTETFKHGTGNELSLDRIYVLQNFENAFENGQFVEKWTVNKRCSHNLHYWGYDNITAGVIVCVQFQGKASKLFEILSLHPGDKKVMFTSAEIPLHDTYGSKEYWDCRKSMKFSKRLVDIADKYIREILECDKIECDNYISVHWRRQDFARNRKNDIPSIAGAAMQINKLARKLKITKIFIATDATESELDDLNSVIETDHAVYSFEPSEYELKTYKDGGVAIIDQIICSRAAYFIGTHESTFTFRIQEEREILGFQSDSTFNRLCPDVGKCERLSRWTIVN